MKTYQCEADFSHNSGDLEQYERTLSTVFRISNNTERRKTFLLLVEFKLQIWVYKQKMSVLDFSAWSREIPQEYGSVAFEEFASTVQVERANGKLSPCEDLGKETIRFWYDVIQENREKWMKNYFDHRLSLEGKRGKIASNLKSSDVHSDTQHTSLRTKTSLTRFVRNIQYFDLLNTPLCGHSKFTEVNIVRCIWQRGKIPFPIRNVDSCEQVIAGIKLFTSKASIFPPETVGCILDRVLKAKYVFFPVVGWTSYLLGFHISKATHCLGIDANPENVRMNQILKDGFGYDEKIEIWQGRTELQEVPDLLKFCGGFDSVFWSPPYYTRELYQGKDQSHKTFKDYPSWLSGFYGRVIRTCYKVLTRPLGKMVIVISDQTIGKVYYPLVADTLKLATNVGFRSTHVIPMAIQSARKAQHSDKPPYELMLVFEKPDIDAHF